MALSETQIGILRDVWANRVDLKTCGEWMRDQLCEFVMMGKEGLVDTLGDSVILTPEGLSVIAEANARPTTHKGECR